MEDNPADAQHSTTSVNGSKPVSSLCAVHTVPGVIPQWTKPGQVVTWNLAGQVAFAEGASIIILTPYTPPPAAFAKLANKSRPPPPATAIVVSEEMEEAPSIPPEFDRIPCWKGRFSVETAREPKLHAEMSQLLFHLNEPNMLFGPKDPGVKALAWSPKGLAPLGGCVLAVLETNLNLTIRSTERDFIQGAWLDVCNLNEETYKLSSEPEGVPDGSADSQLRRARELLFQNIAWSNAPILPFPWGARPHDSLLAVGSRSGTLALWQFNTQRQWTRVFHEVIVGQWISHLAWSEWKTTGTSEYAATSELAFACDDGSVYSIMVKLQFGDDGNHSSVTVGNPILHIQPNSSAITGLQFAHGHLVCTRIGIAQLVGPNHSYVEEIRLKKIGNWPSCSPYSPCNGIGAMSERSILISLYSGEQHVIRFQDGRPVLDSAASERLSSGMRRTVEEADISIDESIARKSPRVTGFTLAPAMIGDGGSTLFACIFEPANLQDFHFPKDNNRKHTLIIGNLATQLFGESREEVDVGSETPQSAFDSYAASQTASSALLPYFPGILPPRTMSRLLRTSLYLGQTRPEANQSIATTRETALAYLRYRWMDSRKAKIFQLANVWRMWHEDFARTPFDNADVSGAQQAIFEPAFEYMAIVNGMDGGDQAANLEMISRILQLSGGSSSSQTLQAYRRKLADSLPRGTDLAGKTTDTCLICSENIPFKVNVEQVTPALCQRKHVWGRCSITYRLITTPFVRTCSTCHAKSLLPKAYTPENPWSIEQDMLHAATSCPRCGGLWRSVV